jgi:hypothetical protein
MPIARFEALVHRLHDWRDGLGAGAPDVEAFVGPSFDYDLATLEAVRRMRARCGWKMEILNLGGQKMRAGPDLAHWLDEIRTAGIIGFHASLAGLDAVHDKWNSRAGDFAYQTEILRMGGALGMVRHERLFLAKNTLPVMDRLLDVLEAIPGEIRDRYVVPFFYAGTATKYEEQRIDENDRDNLSRRVKALRLWRFETWLSEREWLSRLKESAETLKDASLFLHVDETNIDRLEALACEEIVAEAQRDFLADWTVVPDAEELCERHGDPNGRKIYSSADEVEARLLDIHRRRRAGAGRAL